VLRLSETLPLVCSCWGLPFFPWFVDRDARSVPPFFLSLVPMWFPFFHGMSFHCYRYPEISLGLFLGYFWDKYWPMTDLYRGYLLCS
jgi:hypothetical protein